MARRGRKSKSKHQSQRSRRPGVAPQQSPRTPAVAVPSMDATEDASAQVTEGATTGSDATRSSGRPWAILLPVALVVALLGYVALRRSSTDSRPAPDTRASAENREAAHNRQASGGRSTVQPGAEVSGKRLGRAASTKTLLTTSAVKHRQEKAETQLDPRQDGWESEAVAEQVKLQLTRLASRLAGESVANILESEVSSTIRCGPLRPDVLDEVFSSRVDDQELVVRQANSQQAVAADEQGREALIRALDALAKPFSATSEVHIHIKVIRVTTTLHSATTTALFEADGQTSQGTIQQRATWDCQWRRLPDGGLQLTSLEASSFSEVESAGPWLVDCTRAVLQQNRSFDEQLAFGLNHWLSRLGKVNGMHVFTRNGIAVGDVNGDGCDDVYVCQPGGLPNRLYVQQIDGTAVDRSREAGVDWLDQTSGALLIDLDNDGDQDLVAATVAGLLVMENDGQGHFRLRSTLATNDTDTQSLSAADYDNDGDVDLYVCLEFPKQLTLQYDTDVSFVYHDANDGAANVLFRNDINGGNWKFTDVTEPTGLDEDNRRHSLACAWEDFDNDGDQDLYVANDYGQNCLYENSRGKFKNIASVAEVVDSASGMSVSWGDYDLDGWMDLYVANMFSSAGSRITRQPEFKSTAGDSLRNVYARFAKGNTLFKNEGRGPFRDTGRKAGVEMARWAWSSVFADLNNDTREDLLVANGYITTEDSGDL